MASTDAANQASSHSGAGRPRNKPRTAQGPVREEILGAAARLFARDGVAATTMAGIAAEVGMAVSSLYYYFASKHDVLEQIVLDVNHAPLAAADDARANFGTGAARLHAFIRGDAAAICAFPFDINEIHRLAGQDPTTFARYWEDRRQLTVKVRAFIEQGQAEGAFRSADPHLAALTVLANDEAVQNWFRLPMARSMSTEVGAGVTTNTNSNTDTNTNTEASFSAGEIAEFLADQMVGGLLIDPSKLEEIRSVPPEPDSMT